MAFWSTDRLMVMKDEILPGSKTVLEAIKKARERWGNSKITHPWFTTKFTDEFGESPRDFLGKESVEDEGASGEIHLLNRRIKVLESELRELNKQSKVAAMVKSMLHEAVERKPEPPNWLTRSPSKKMFHGVPTLFVSDIHHGETVFPGQVGGANQFNPEISRKRCERIFSKTVYLLENVFSGSGYPGIVLALGGDMVSGNIHEELRETNAMSIFEAVLDLVDILVAGIELLKSRFGRVFVPCVVGNHGRLDRKPRAKFGPHDNFEYILYHILKRHFSDDPNVTVVVPDSFTCKYRVFGTRYLLTHGDQFRGGNGIAGPIVPWATGDHKLRKQMASIESWTGDPTEYDILIFGHWHRYFPGPGFICNGSIKGFDEYAKKCGFDFEPPQQALWMTTPDRGVTFPTRVFAEEPPKKTRKERSWVSVLGDR